MEELFMFLGLASPLVAATAGFAAAWLSASKRAKRLEEMISASFTAEERLEDLEEAVRRVTSQLETIRDEQEFLARVVEKGLPPGDRFGGAQRSSRAD